jgi:hypothetical protein
VGDFKLVLTPVFSVHFVQQTQTLTPTLKSPNVRGGVIKKGNIGSGAVFRARNIGKGPYL